MTKAPRAAAANDAPRSKAVPEPIALSERDAAVFLGVSARSLRRMRQRGDGPVWSSYGGVIRYLVPDLQAFAVAHRIVRATADGRQRAKVA